MQIGNFEIAPFLRENLWLGTSILPEARPVLVKMIPLNDGSVLSEARLVSEVVPDAPYKLVDIFIEDTRGLAGYALLLPGSVSRLDESQYPPAAVALRVAASLSILHRSGIVYGSFDPISFVLAGDHAVPCEFARAVRMSADDGRVCATESEPSQGRRSMTEYDAPELRASEYDGRKADIYGLGMLLRSLGLRDGESGEIAASMLNPDPTKRPDLDRVLGVLAMLSPR